jgi:hypothetical protein
MLEEIIDHTIMLTISIIFTKIICFFPIVFDRYINKMLYAGGLKLTKMNKGESRNKIL